MVKEKTGFKLEGLDIKVAIYLNLVDYFLVNHESV